MAERGGAHWRARGRHARRVAPGSAAVMGIALVLVVGGCEVREKDARGGTGAPASASEAASPRPAAELRAHATTVPEPVRAEVTDQFPPDSSLRDPRETHLTNLRQLTSGGQNAEAYFSFDGRRLVYQSTPEEGGCDQIHTLDLETGERALVSTGEGRTTCSYFYPSGERILYSSTHHYAVACPPEPDLSQGYVWAIYPSYDVFVTRASGGPPVQLTSTWGYDAEATFSPRGDRIVFTSMRDGDLDLYTMAPDGSEVRRITDRLGYDGGAFFSPDGTKIVWRAHYPETPDEIADYRALLAQGLIRPSRLDIYVADADGSNVRRLTQNGAANFAPYWHPSGEKILFSSNLADATGREFDLYMVGLDGGEPERITFTPEFDGFPVFSPDGSRLVFASNRAGSAPGETNVFIADWVEG